jgi:ATP-dependent DNA helicase RecQ
MVSPHPLPLYDLALLPDDEPARWTSRLRTGLVTLAAEHGSAQDGLEVLAALFPNGHTSAGLTERDLWARLLLRAGRIQEALACAEARRQTRDSYLPRMIMLEALLADGNLDAAAEVAQGIVAAADPQSVAPSIAGGLLALRRACPDQAEAAFREALALRPDNVPALRGLGDALALAGDTQAAAGVLRDAIQICGADARPELLHRLVDLCPEERASVEAQIRPALEELADRLRLELAEVRAAPHRPTRSRASHTGAAPLSRSERVAPAGADLLAHTRVDGNEVPSEQLARALFQHFGHTSFRPGQAAVLHSVLSDGKDTLAVMPTGAGKSLCFQLPALLMPGVVLVVSPLVALMADQLASLADVPALAGRTTFINSTLQADELDRRLRGVAAGAFNLVYAAPERLRQAGMLHALRRAGVSLLVIDEAHCLCLWGHAFRPDYLAIGQLAEALGHPRILAVTATATPDMQAEIAHTLARHLAVVNTGVLRDNLFLEVRSVTSDREKWSRLVEFVQGTRGAGIIYVGSRDRCEQLAARLRKFGESAAYYHAGLPAAERDAVQRDFMSGRVRVLVATIAFGMGVNKRDIRFIVHYQPARSLEAYTQEVGRAGRDGQPAHCLLLATSSDKGTLTRRAHEDHVDVAALRDLYRRVRRAVQQGQGAPVDFTALLDPAGDGSQAEVPTRVGLSVLERAGFLSRGLDTPRDFTLLLAHEPETQEERALVRMLELRPGRQRIARVADLADLLGVELDGVEAALSDWQERSLFQFSSSRRGIVLRLADPAPPDGAQRMSAILSAIDQASDARARALVRYIEATGCRNAVVAHHFGVAAEATCGRCDTCAPDGRRATRSPAAKPLAPRVTGLSAEEAILRLVEELPFAAGRTGLSRILTGANSSPIGPERCRLFGALAGRRQVDIAHEIDNLLDGGLLTTVAWGKGYCLALTDKGRRAIQR